MDVLTDVSLYPVGGVYGYNAMYSGLAYLRFDPVLQLIPAAAANGHDSVGICVDSRAESARANGYMQECVTHTHTHTHARAVNGYVLFYIPTRGPLVKITRQITHKYAGNLLCRANPSPRLRQVQGWASLFKVAIGIFLCGCMRVCVSCVCFILLVSEIILTFFVLIF
jgi:hypothetical protein